MVSKQAGDVTEDLNATYSTSNGMHFRSYRIEAGLDSHSIAGANHPPFANECLAIYLSNLSMLQLLNQSSAPSREKRCARLAELAHI